jgi:lysyl-tRNA synthetase class I
MEIRMSISSALNPTELKFSLENISRCPKCNLICTLQLDQKDNESIVLYNCENNHNGEISLNEYLRKYKEN